jgi:glutamate carboxypeptidase
VSWITHAAERIAGHAERELEALVAVSSPSGDRQGAEEALAVCTALLPDAARAERPACSSPGHAPDLLARLPGSGERRVVLLGHIDTVHGHGSHRPLRREGQRLVGPGAVDMKGGVVVALGLMRALAERPESFQELALLLVCDEEWRTAPFAHAGRFRDWDACLCFEAGQQGPGGAEGVVIKRKAAGTLRVTATGTSAHSGSAPERGRNALVALCEAARVVASHHYPDGPERLTAVPTVLRSGDAFNIVPADGELFCDLRAEQKEAFLRVARALPGEVGGAGLRADFVRMWPGMDAREATAVLLERAGARLGRSLAGSERGGASDASHLAAVVPVTVDGLGPRGGGAHTGEEYILAPTLRERAELSLALAAEILAIDAPA